MCGASQCIRGDIGIGATKVSELKSVIGGEVLTEGIGDDEVVGWRSSKAAKVVQLYSNCVIETIKVQ